MPTLAVVSSAERVEMREIYQHEIAIATTPKTQKKAYRPMYIPTSLLVSIVLAADHHLSHTAVVFQLVSSPT
jgi:hypothetical protein